MIKGLMIAIAKLRTSKSGFKGMDVETLFLMKRFSTGNKNTDLSGRKL